MIEQKQGLPALEKLFKKYHFEPVATVMMTRPEWKPCVGLTVRGTTFIYIIYNSGTAEHYLERLAYRGLAEQIMCEFRKQGVKIHT